MYIGDDISVRGVKTVEQSRGSCISENWVINGLRGVWLDVHFKHTYCYG